MVFIIFLQMHNVIFLRVKWFKLFYSLENYIKHLKKKKLISAAIILWKNVILSFQKIEPENIT